MSVFSLKVKMCEMFLLSETNVRVSLCLGQSDFDNCLLADDLVE